MSIEDTSTVQTHSVWVPVGLTVVDRLITVPNFHLESNPLVTHLGVFNWILLTVGVLSMMVVVWYMCGMYRSHIAQACVILLTLLMSLVIAGNVYVLALV